MAYIDVGKFVNFIRNSNMEKQDKNTVLVAMQLQPTADVVEVVRCKNCLHKINYKGRAMCTLYAEEAFGVWYGLNATRDEHFCSYGERKDT